jgi:phosphoribosylcarboxyaminoimidazole (NCAIR) mutase
MGKQVAIVMGSSSDLRVMEEAVKVLKELGIEPEVDIVSAHRTPQKMFDFAKMLIRVVSRLSSPVPVVLRIFPE